MFKNFDGSFDYLIYFHEKLKKNYYRFQIVRSYFFDLIKQIVYYYYFLSKVNDYHINPTALHMDKSDSTANGKLLTLEQMIESVDIV